MVSAFLKDFPLGHEATTEGAQLLRSVRNYVAQSVGREEGGLYTVARSPRSHQSHAATPVSFHSVELNEERIPFSMPQSGTEHLPNDVESSVELAAHEESHGAEPGVDVTMSTMSAARPPSPRRQPSLSPPILQLQRRFTKRLRMRPQEMRNPSSAFHKGTLQPSIQSVGAKN